MRKQSAVLFLSALTCVSAAIFVPWLATSPQVFAALQDTAEQNETAAEETASPVAPAAGEQASLTEPTDAQTSTDAAAVEQPVAVAAATEKEAEVEIPFGSRPYRVRISIAFDNQSATRNAVREQFIGDVELAVARMYGRMWAADIEINEWLIPGHEARLERLQLPDVFDLYPEEECDKAFILTVESSGRTFNISCREYDPRIHELTPLYSERTLDPRSVGAVAARLMRDSFRPVLLYVRQFDDEEGRSLMELQTQAGELRPPDASADQVRKGDVLRPFVRSMERRNPKKLQQLKALPLSYIRAMSVDREVARGMVTGYYATHMTFSLFGGKGRRLQHLAVRQRPTAGRSRVRLVLQSRQDKPLISHRLAIAYQLGWKDEEDGPQTQLVSDRNGEVVIETRENHPTFWIRVYSGASLLARVPYAPGLLPYDMVALPDDSVRLGVEGELQLLQDQLIDSIAMQGVLLARARKAAEAQDAKAVEKLLGDYRNVPAKKEFLESISNIRIPAVQESTRRRMGSTRIDRLCQKLGESVETFFSDEKRVERQAELKQIESAVGL
ncbi:MAG: hypothetical protein GY758_01665 [Fuerstiella sp.]|nr:hypothetical protein [Fuerstiella sp.]MCP4509127.1 hypothetical protein [Fuerstiella sp.]